MGRAEECQRHAAECVRLAQQISTPGDKATLLEMAQKWRELAARAERSEHQESSKR